MDRNKDGVFGIFWKFARVGERLSPYVSLACIGMAVRTIFSESYMTSGWVGGIMRFVKRERKRWKLRERICPEYGIRLSTSPSPGGLSSRQTL